MQSSVYASFTAAGFLAPGQAHRIAQSQRVAAVYLLFQPSCAALTFCLAVSAVKGGTGGLAALSSPDIVVGCRSE